VLVLVMGGLLLLTVSAAAFFEQGDDVRSTTVAMTSQRLASARSDEAAQYAIALVKAGIPGLGNLPPCSGPSTSLRIGSCATTDMVTGTFELPGTPGNGGGWYYQYWVYRPAPVIVGGFPIPLSNQVVNVYAEGYFGRADAGVQGFTISAIEAEVLIPKPPSNVPVYDGDFGIIQ
jgi:hypothetical protein